MKSIVFISILVAFCFKVSKALIIYPETVVLILFGVCLIGLAKIGRKFKNGNYKYSGKTIRLLVGNILLKRQIKTNNVDVRKL